MNTNPHVASLVAGVLPPPIAFPSVRQNIKTRLAGKAQVFSNALTGSPRAFLLSTIFTLALGILGLFAFSWYVNPWGNFGPTGFHILGDARRAKTNYIDALPPKQLPQASCWDPPMSCDSAPT